MVALMAFVSLALGIGVKQFEAKLFRNNLIGHEFNSISHLPLAFIY
jgi:hypothetical protein